MKILAALAIGLMGGALAVTAFGYRFVLGRQGPILDTDFQLPAPSLIDAPRLAGSAVFGIGWGIAALCPDGLFPVLVIGRPESHLFLAGLIDGLVLAQWLERHLRAPRRAGRPIRL